MDGYMNQIQANRIPNSNVIRAQDAIIEEIRISGNVAYVTISYGIPNDFNTINMELVTLVVNRNTVIQNRRGESLNVQDLREGMLVDAVFSATMTFSMPPQSRAYWITVLGNINSGQRPRPDTEITVGTVIQIDTRNGFEIGRAHV